MDEKLKIKILFEISQIDKLLNDGKPLLDLCKLKTPDFIEVSAAICLRWSGSAIDAILITKGEAA